VKSVHTRDIDIFSRYISPAAEGSSSRPTLSNEEIPAPLNDHHTTCSRSDHLRSVRPVSHWCQTMAPVADNVSVALWNKAMSSFGMATSVCMIPCTGDRTAIGGGKYGVDVESFASSMVTNRDQSSQVKTPAIPSTTSRQGGSFAGRGYPLPLRLRRLVLME
jgi:hypothetical protein